MSDKTLNEQISALAQAFGKALKDKANKRGVKAVSYAMPIDLEDSNTLGCTYIPSIPKSAKTTLTYPKGSHIVLSNGVEYKLDADTSVDLSSVNASQRAGKDVYVWAGLKAGEIKLEAALDSASHTALENAVVIGGFHGLCKAVSGISGHPLNGYAEGDILPNSVWTETHRPISDPEGMVWCPEIGKWVDIYLPSWDGSKIVSKYQGTILDGNSSEIFNGVKFVEYAGLVHKELISQPEFWVVATGSNQLTNITGNSDPGTTGGHVDIANRRMISNYGLEDCCGVMYQFASTSWEYHPKATLSGMLFSGYAWYERPVRHTSYQTTVGGQSYGVPRRALLGGCWGNSTDCGSRYVRCDSCSSDSHADFSSRLVSSPKIHPVRSIGPFRQFGEPEV